jgi:hypothetical protein
MNLSGPRTPVLLAIGLGLLSVPLVAAGLIQPLPEWKQQIVEAPPLGFVGATVLALASALTASLVGGSLGGTLVRTRPVAAVLVALATAWPLGIGMLSITGAALGIQIRAGVLCIDTCNAMVTSEDGFSGFSAYPESLLGAAVFVVPIVLAVILLAVAVWLALRGRMMAGVIVIVGAYAALHAMSIFGGNGIPFACLAIGVTIWARLLHRADLNPVVTTPVEAIADAVTP